MIVTSSRKIIAGSRILINDSINEFLGTVNNLWSNPANWSLGILPTANTIAVIRANCDANTNATVRSLINKANLTIQETLIVRGFVSNNQKIICVANFNRYLDFNGTASNLIAGNIDPISLVAGLQDTPIDITNIIAGKTVIRIGIRDSDVTLNVNLTGVLIGFAGTGIINNKSLNLGAGVSHIEGTFLGPGTAAVSLGGGYNGFIVNLVNLVEIIGITVDYYRVSANNSSLIKTIIKGGIFKAWYGTNLPLSQTIFNTGNCTLVTAGNIHVTLGSLLIESVSVDHSRNSLSEYPRLTISALSGTNGNSIFNNKNYLGYVGDNGHLDLMPTNGKFYCNFEHSLVEYWKEGNQFIKVPDDKYRELRLSTSGVKKLTGNTQCDHLYFTGTATLDLNGFNLTGYTKYTDAGNISRDIPSGNFDIVSIGPNTVANTKTLTGNITCNIFNVVRSSYSNINYNGFTITATEFNDLIHFNNCLNHKGGIINNLNWVNDLELSLTDDMYVNGIANIVVLTSSVKPSGGRLIMNDGSTFLLTNNEVGKNASLTKGIGSYYNLDLTPNGGSASVTRTLTENIIVRGTFTMGANVTLIKNGFTIKNESGVELN